ncbi:MAG: DmsE family decaheme c-type cytochrome [Terriglobia bacterium]
MPNIDLVRRRNFALCGVAAFLFISGGLQAQRPTTVPKAFGDEYAGSATCQICHEDNFNNVTKTNPHRVVETDKKLGFADHVCESCHGPGAKHASTGDVAFIRSPLKLSPGEADKICLNCHANQQTHLGLIQNSHSKFAIACVSCHKMHVNGGALLVARKNADVNQLCESCHANVKAQFLMPYRHKIPENAMTCTDCHNPHGIPRQGMQQSFAGSEPPCLTCHGDKRGPFTFEHAPVKFEGCTACHEQHGSANPRMLIRHEVRQVCLECHANMPTSTPGVNAMGVVPPAFHDLRSARYQNCTICHQKIHGSYVDRNLLK